MLVTNTLDYTARQITDFSLQLNSVLPRPSRKQAAQNERSALLEGDCLSMPIHSSTMLYIQCPPALHAQPESHTSVQFTGSEWLSDSIYGSKKSQGMQCPSTVHFIRKSAFLPGRDHTIVC